MQLKRQFGLWTAVALIIGQVIADEEAAKENLLRVFDESGEDYAFASNRFHVVELPSNVQKTLLQYSTVPV